MASKWNIIQFIIDILKALKLFKKPDNLNLEDMRPADPKDTKVDDVI